MFKRAIFPRVFRIRRFLLGIVVCLTVAAAPQSGRAQKAAGRDAARALEQDFVDTIAKTEPSVVSIARIKDGERVLSSRRLDPFGPNLRRRRRLQENPSPQSPDFIPNDFAAGVVIRPPAGEHERLILTTYHAVRGGPVVGGKDDSDFDLYVRLANRRAYHARIYAADPHSDLALLTVDYAALHMQPSEIRPISLGDATGIRKGRLVLVLGNPYAIGRDGSPSVSRGMISNIARRPAPAGSPFDEETREKETIHHFGTLLQVDARLNLGTSGGALVNLDGELIGVTTALAALEGYEKSVGYAIPVDKAGRRIIESLCRGYEVEYGFLGVKPDNVSLGNSPSLLQRFDQPSAVVVSVVPNSPADRAGLASRDVILEVNGETIYDRYDLMREIGLLGPEATARLRVWRQRPERELQISVELGKWPAYDAEGIVAPNRRHPAWRGLVVDHPTSRRKFVQPSSHYPDAVAVRQVLPESPAARAGLQSGDFVARIDGTSVRVPDEFHEAAQGLNGDVTLQLLDGRTVTVHE